MSMLFRIPLTRLLFNEAPSGEGGPGSGAPGGSTADVAFTPEQQAKVNSILAAERRKLQGTVGDLEKRIAESERRAAEFEAEKAKAAEEAELKGKSELEKLQHQLKKAGESYKSFEGESAKKYAELEGKLKARDTEFVGYVKKTLVSEAILPGAAEGMGPYALEAFLREADIQLGEGNALAGVIYEGKTYEKAADAAKAFFAKAPGFAKAPAGGAGSPRVPGAPAKAGQSFVSGADAFGAALTNR